MAAIIFWTVIFCAVFFTVGFMVCAVAEYISNDIEKRVSLNEWKKKFIIADIIPFVFIIIFWLI
jgi:hypothetical protein